MFNESPLNITSNFRFQIRPKVEGYPKRGRPTGLRSMDRPN